MAPRLRLIPSKAQRAADIADGTAQGIEGHVADPPKVLTSDTTTDMAVGEDEDEDDLALAIQGTSITLDDDEEDDSGGHVDEMVKASIPSGSKKYVSFCPNPFNHFLTLPIAQSPCSSGDRKE